MFTNKNLANAIFLALLIALLSACQTDLNTVIPNLGFKTFTVRMTDGPTDVDEVNIDLDLVVIKGEGPWDTLQMQTYRGIYNLLDYQNGLDTVIARVLTTFDVIKEIRLVLGDTNFVVARQDTFELKIPSGSQSGLKIKTCIDLTGVDEYELIIDFDAAASLHRTGNGRYQLKPVIRPLNPDASCGGGRSSDDDVEDIPYGDLPQAVVEYFRSNYPNFRPEQVERGLLCDDTEVYLVSGKAGNKNLIVAFETDGTWRETSVKIEVTDVPMPVAEAVVEDYADYQLREAYRVTTAGGETLYRIEVKKDDVETTLIYQEDGALICAL